MNWATSFCVVGCVVGIGMIISNLFSPEGALPRVRELEDTVRYLKNRVQDLEKLVKDSIT
jgi:hypothetical protein